MMTGICIHMANLRVSMGTHVKFMTHPVFKRCKSADAFLNLLLDNSNLKAVEEEEHGSKIASADSEC